MSFLKSEDNLISNAIHRWRKQRSLLRMVIGARSSSHLRKKRKREGGRSVYVVYFCSVSLTGFCHCWDTRHGLALWFFSARINIYEVHKYKVVKCTSIVQAGGGSRRGGPLV